MKQLTSVMVAAVLAACGASANNAAKDGDLHGHCYPNATCNAGLMCAGGVCVEGIDVDAAIVHDSPIDDSAVIHDAHPDSSIIPDAAIDSSIVPDAAIDSGVTLIDAPQQDAATTCDVLAQTGCLSTEKCTWIHDTDSPPLGHIGCAPNGAVAVGAACTYGASGATGYDNCTKGNVCNGVVCEAICDSNGGTPMCDATHACQVYDGLFANSGATTIPAGVCDPSCNPLDDNDFDGSGSAHAKVGSACGSDVTNGCYGFPSATTTTHFTCAHPAAGTETLHHRSVLQPSQEFLNSCAPGYTIAFSQDATGSTNVDCYAFCKPGDAYNALVGTQAPNGVAPHRCNTTDALGAFGATPTAVTNGTNGEHCMYSWLFEVDTAGMLHLSPTSNTVGICFDHSKYQYDSNGDGTVDTVIPACTALPLTQPSGSLLISATDVACISTTTAGLSFAGKPKALRRPLFNLPVVPAFAHH